MEDTEGKVCSKCGKYKLLFCFNTYKASGGIRKYTSSCKLCGQEYRATQKAHRSDYNKQYKQRKKEDLGKDGYKQYRREEYEAYQEKYKELNNDVNKLTYAPEEARRARLKFETRFFEEHGYTYYEHCRESKQEYKLKNKDRIKAWAKQYIEKNKEVLKAKAARYYINNKEYIDSKSKQYYEANPEQHRIRSFNTYSKRKNALGEFTHEDRVFLFKIQEGKCKYCFADLSTGKPELDHQVPIAQGGSNYVENIAVTCRECNRSKGPRTHEEFLEFLEVAHPKKYRNYIKHHMQEMPNYYVWYSTIDTTLQFSVPLAQAA